jgi:NitT/TauT family transport system ATP-binding protein
VALELQDLHLQMERSKTVVFVTHSIQEAVLLADRVLVFSSTPGQVVDDIRVDLPRPRSMGDTLTLEFREIEARIREKLGGHFTRGAADAAGAGVVA